MQKFRKISLRFARKFFQKVGEISHLFPRYLSRLVYRLQRYRCNRFKKMDFFRKKVVQKLSKFSKKMREKLRRKASKKSTGGAPKNPPEGLQKVRWKAPRFPSLPVVWVGLAHALRIGSSSQFVSKNMISIVLKTFFYHKNRQPTFSKKVVQLSSKLRGKSVRLPLKSAQATTSPSF